jgi:hypothetical protein
LFQSFVRLTLAFKVEEVNPVDTDGSSVREPRRRNNKRRDMQMVAHADDQLTEAKYSDTQQHQQMVGQNETNAALRAHAEGGLCCAYLFKGKKLCPGARIGNSPYCSDHDYNSKGRLTGQQWTKQIVFVEQKRPFGYCLAWLNNGTFLCPGQQVDGSPYCSNHDHNCNKGARVFW